MSRYAEHLNQLVTYFPIGEKINYYPEYLEDINLETMILGYEVNENPIYVRDHVRQPDDATVEFFLEDSGETLTAADLSIVPDTSDLEKTLDYGSKAVIGKSGQFVGGNSITLVAAATDKGTPIMDTTVLRQMLVKQGVYQDYKVVALDPTLESLTKKEHREKKRLELSLACTLFSPIDSPSGHSCKLIDCSELCVGIEMPCTPADGSPLVQGTPAQLCIPMPSQNKSFELMGEIFAIRSEDIVVLKLQGIKKGDKFEDLQLVDRLELRASLVQCCHA